VPIRTTLPFKYEGDNDKLVHFLAEFDVPARPENKYLGFTHFTKKPECELTPITSNARLGGVAEVSVEMVS